MALDIDPRLLNLLEGAGYDPVSELGRGGMGIVLLARQRSLDRPVAVKLLLDQCTQDESMLKRFRAEARLLRDLAHPNIVRVLDVEPDAEVPYIAFEFLEDARTLDDILMTEKVPFERALKLAHGVVTALAYLHGRGIVHRDLKPGNVLVGRDDEPRVIDMGLARRVSSDETRHTAAGQVIGTLSYMPAEQMMGADASPAADVFSWGLIAYELVCGRHVFSTLASTERIPPTARIAREVPPIDERCPGVDRRIAELVTAALALEPGPRPTAAAIETRLASLRESIARGDRADATLAGSLLTTDPLPALGRWCPGASLSAGPGGTRVAVPQARGRGGGAQVTPSSAVASTAPRSAPLLAAAFAIFLAGLAVVVPRLQRATPVAPSTPPSTSEPLASPPARASSEIEAELASLDTALSALRPADLVLHSSRRNATPKLPPAVVAAIARVSVAAPAWFRAPTAPALRRSLLARLYELDVVDAWLDRMKLPRLGVSAALMPEGWGESVHAYDKRDSPHAHDPARDKVEGRANAKLESGALTGDETVRFGPQWCVHLGLNLSCAMKKSDPVSSWTVSFDLTESELAAARRALLALTTSDPAHTVVRVQLNRGPRIAYCLPSSPGMPAQPDHRERVRGIPIEFLQPGRNVARIAIEPYPGRDRVSPVYIGLLHVVLIR